MEPVITENSVSLRHLDSSAESAAGSVAFFFNTKPE